MGALRNTLAWLYQRYRPFFDRLPAAVGMALLFTLVEHSTGAFPVEWRTFIAAVILASGLALPLAGYILLIVALAYPLFTISIYVAALALSVLIIWAFLFPRHLTAVVLVLAVPLLAPYRFAPLVPLLAGLWWGEWAGVLAGMGGALWLKLFAGMCGATPDLTRLSAQTLQAERLMTRFHSANSLQTLLWMWEPLAPHPQALLLNILEVLGWGLAGYGIGILCHRMDRMARPYLGLLAGLSAALLGAGLGSLIAPLALGLFSPSALAISHIANFLIEWGISGVATAILYMAYRYLNRPVIPPSFRKGRAASGRSAESPSSGVQSGALAMPLASWSSPSPEEEQEDIIMIDLD
ncbi:MAG: hypothetical protein N2508_12875 [Anaerolineae bacterium]|nr:hypothetical protein [Anaerolineae bacterium]